MRWRRGLVRLWIVVSACWIGLVAWQTYRLNYSAQAATERSAVADSVCAQKGLAYCFAHVRETPPPLSDTLPVSAAAALLPPLGALAIYAAGAWIVGDFRRDGTAKRG